jgi:2,5-furandicarboxylate decarboxylase 1
MARNLQAFVEELRRRPGDLVEIARAVKPHEFEVTALLKQLEERHCYPAVLFRNPLSLLDEISAFPLLTNCYASRERCALMLGADPAASNFPLSQTYGAMLKRGIDPVVIAPELAPVRQTSWTGRDADVRKLPIVRHFQMDIGPTLTMTHVMRSRDGVYNVSFAKTFYKWDARQMVVSVHTRDLGQCIREQHERGETARIVNVIGHHPAFHLGSINHRPWGHDDYKKIGAFLGEPLRLTPSVTWGDEFLVPADAEIIMEAELPPDQLDVCDPFGEVARLYQAQCLRPVFNVKAISFRRGAIVQDIFSGFRDSNSLGAIFKEGQLDNIIRPRFPNLHEIHAPDSGCGVYAAYISVRNIQAGQAEEIGRAALDAIRIMQLVVIVDADIDVFDEGQVIWALHTYADLLKGIRRHGESYILHSGFATTNWGGKIVIDATRPSDFAFGSRSEVPPEAMQRIKLADYLPNDAVLIRA